MNGSAGDPGSDDDGPSRLVVEQSKRRRAQRRPGPSQVVVEQPKRRRAQRRPFPALPFEEALSVGSAVQKYAAGQKVRRLTLFDNMGKPADSQASRTLLTASGQYGITLGSYKAEFIELTQDGRIATSDSAAPEEKLRSFFRLGISGNEWFGRLYEDFKDNRLPDKSVLADSLRDRKLDTEYINECVETFMVNAKFIGLLQTVAGAERLLTIDFVIEEGVGGKGKAPVAYQELSTHQVPPAPVKTSNRQASDVVDDVCFYITPIGDEATEFRQHSDLFMGSLVEPALAEFNIKLVRADQISEPGLITAQVIEHIVRARLVIADLSFHNPNVFYELALRHAVKKPIVQLIRTADRVPFDLQPFRTIPIDTTSIYTLVPRLETYRAEISSQIRIALDSDPGDAENPLTAFYPEFWSQIGR
jgi:hypothetical protein